MFALLGRPMAIGLSTQTDNAWGVGERSGVYKPRRTSTSFVPRRRSFRRRGLPSSVLCCYCVAMTTFCLLLWCWPSSSSSSVAAFSIARNENGGGPSSFLYGIQGAGWTSPTWNWGYAVGTGHDCAAMCRKRWSTRRARQELVSHLLQEGDSKEPVDFEEVKLILALAWQRGRWDGSDGGRENGYGAVLATMADAERYEKGPTEEDNARRLVQDMAERFSSLQPTSEAVESMARACQITDHDQSFRICSGLVLQAIGFVDKGL